jgi:hypothetical protein
MWPTCTCPLCGHPYLLSLDIPNDAKTAIVREGDSVRILWTITCLNCCMHYEAVFSLHCTRAAE